MKYKIPIRDKEQAFEVQKILFDLGLTWLSGSTELKWFNDATYIAIEENDKFGWLHDGQVNDYQTYEQIDI